MCAAGGPSLPEVHSRNIGQEAAEKALREQERWAQDVKPNGEPYMPAPNGWRATKGQFMSKRGGVRKNWLKRWFILKGNQLKYYSDDSMKDLKGSIDMRHCSVVRISTAPNASPTELELVCTERTYRLE